MIKEGDFVHVTKTDNYDVNLKVGDIYQVIDELEGDVQMYDRYGERNVLEKGKFEKVHVHLTDAQIEQMARSTIESQKHAEKQFEKMVKNSNNIIANGIAMKMQDSMTKIPLSSARKTMNKIKEDILNEKYKSDIEIPVVNMITDMAMKESLRMEKQLKKMLEDELKSLEKQRERVIQERMKSDARFEKEKQMIDQFRIKLERLLKEYGE